MKRVSQLERRHDTAMELIAAELFGLRGHIDDRITSVEDQLTAVVEHVDQQLTTVVEHVDQQLTTVVEHVDQRLITIVEHVDDRSTVVVNHVTATEHRMSQQFELHGQLLNQILGHLDDGSEDG